MAEAKAMTLVERLRERAPLMPKADAAMVREVITALEAAQKALEPFAAFGENAEITGWTSKIHREQISVWFGSKDFYHARTVYSMLKGSSHPDHPAGKEGA